MYYSLIEAYRRVKSSACKTKYKSICGRFPGDRFFIVMFYNEFNKLRKA